MLATFLPLLVAAFTPQPPTTVNGQVLGEAKDFATVGPAAVCLRNMVVSPREGEVVYVEYLGIHDARLRLVLADGTDVALVQGDAFQDRRKPEQEPAIKRARHHYYLIGDGESPRYQMVSVEDADLVLFLSGSALAGDRSDEQVIDRLSFGDEQHLNCDRRFGYGWDGVFWTRATNEKSE